MILKVLNRRPKYKLSLIKSIDHELFAFEGTPRVLGVGSANVFYLYVLNSDSSRNKYDRLAYGPY